MAVKYKEETQLKYKMKKEELTKELPGFCKSYFIGRESRLSESTATSYAYIFTEFFDYLHQNNTFFGKKDIITYTLDDISNLTTEDIEEYLHWLRYHVDEDEVIRNNTQLTIEKHLSSLSSLWVYFIKRNQLSFNPTAAIERQKRTLKKPVRLRDDEKEKLFDTIVYGTGMSKHQMVFHDKTSTRDVAIFQLLLDTGVRVSELVGMDISDFNYEKHFVTVVRKGGNQQDIYFGDITQEVISDYLSIRDQFHPSNDEKAMFLSSMGRNPGSRISVRSVQKLTKKYISASNPERVEKISPHKMRSTFGSDLLEATSDLELVSEVLGHQSLQTTQIYAQYDETKKERIRNIMQNRATKDTGTF